jgi:signal transduction histidine kinase/ActR/RegA family two-component response regulator
VRKDGVEILISLTVSPIIDDRGVVIGASKIARDVTERVRLLAAAQQQARITERLSQIGAEVASSLDRSAVVRKVIDAAVALAGAEFGTFVHNLIDRETGRSEAILTTTGLPSQTGRQAVGAAHRPFTGDVIVRVDDLDMDPAHALAAAYLAPGGGALPARSLLAVPVKSSSGAILGGVVLGHSRPGAFTHQHEQLVTGIAAWASLALENARLYLEAREADRLKDEFLAVLSHELRTPLNAIVGYSRLLRGRVLSGEKAERGLDTLERNASVLTQIVEDVLDISRIITGKLRLDVQPVELPLVVHNAVATVQPAADAKSVRLHTIVDPRVGPVSGDPDRLQQVVWNLLSNAVKFTPKGGRVQVTVQRVNSHIEIVVSDTGIGIQADFLPYVFDRFRQADAGTTRKTGGLGLGLSIVRHIVEMHGGSVHVASEGEERGTTFRVKLPLMIVHAQNVREVREHPRTEKLMPLTSLESLQGVRVMAIDDEEDALGLLRVVLEAAGAEVITLSTAVDAIERIERSRPDALVIDLGMPQMDGFELMGRIRASTNAAVRDVPAAALTAFARSDHRTRALQSGFEMHLAKPVDPGELVASVATLVRRGARGR